MECRCAAGPRTQKSPAGCSRNRPVICAGPHAPPLRRDPSRDGSIADVRNARVQRRIGIGAGKTRRPRAPATATKNAAHSPAIGRGQEQPLRHQCQGCRLGSRRSAAAVSSSSVTAPARTGRRRDPPRAFASRAASRSGRRRRAPSARTAITVSPAPVTSATSRAAAGSAASTGGPPIDRAPHAVLAPA